MEITLLIMENHGKNHGIVFLNFCGNPVRIPTISGNHGKPGKSLKISSMHGKIMEFEKHPE